MEKLGLKKLALLALLVLTSLTTTIIFPITKAQGQNWLSGWSYRKTHIIENATGAGTGYQIRVTVHYDAGTDSDQDVYLNSHCRTDFGDIRFTSSDGLTLLNYWMESNVTSDNAVFWINITDDMSSSSVTIYIYYGKTEAPTTSNGVNTFLLFDSFNDNSFNTSMWATYGSPSVTESSGCLNVTTDSVGWVCSNAAFGFNYRVRTRAARNIVSGEALVGFCSTDKANYAFMGDFSGTDDYFFLATKLSGDVNTVYTDLLSDSDTGFHIFDVMRISGSSNIGYVDNEHFVNSTSHIPTVDLPVGMLAYGQNKVCTVDWIAVAKHVNPEPLQGGWGNEETPPDVTSPTFSNPVASTTVANQPCQFNVTVNDNVANGYYIFGTNNSGSWVNDTAVAFTSTPQTLTTIKTLANNPDYAVEWEYWFNDTGNNWNSTGIQTLTITRVLLHDIAVADVERSKTIIGQGYACSINVTVANQGDFDENFGVTVYANEQVIGAVASGTIANGTTKTLILVWNTTGFAYGNYSIKAVADVVTGETDVGDNTLIDGWVLVSIPGDINGDKKVELRDVFTVGKAFGSKRGTDGLYWHSPAKSCCPHSPVCDINDDGTIDLKDYYVTCKNFAKSW
jgi:hypothetical protein